MFIWGIGLLGGVNLVVLFIRSINYRARPIWECLECLFWGVGLFVSVWIAYWTSMSI